MVLRLVAFSMQPSVNQYGSIDSGNAANGQIQSERSVTPLLPDFMDPSLCYLPNAYPSAYYYGGKLTLNPQLEIGLVVDC